MRRAGETQAPLLSLWEGRVNELWAPIPTPNLPPLPVPRLVLCPRLWKSKLGPLTGWAAWLSFP